MITRRIQGWRGNGMDQIHVALTVTTTSVINTTFSQTGTFQRAFEVAPLVMGLNTDRPGVQANARVTATGIQVYIRSNSPSIIADGSVVVTATLEGRVA